MAPSSKTELSPAAAKAIDILRSITGIEIDDWVNYCVIQWFNARLPVLCHDLELTDDEKATMLRVSQDIAQRESEGFKRAKQTLNFDNLQPWELSLLEEQLSFMCWRMDDMLNKGSISGLHHLQHKLEEELKKRKVLG